MDAFNSYVVFDEEGNLIAHERSTSSDTPREYFDGFGPDIQRRAYVMLVLQEGGHVIRYKVKQPSAPTLGPGESFRGTGGSQSGG